MSIQGLKGVALITGAASGIARATAVAFVEAGCHRLCLGDINDDGLEETQNRLRKLDAAVEVLVVHVDVANEKAVQALVDACVQRFGRIDYACNIAGIVPPRTAVENTSATTLDAVAAVNTTGTFLCHRAQIRQMLTQEPLSASGENSEGGCRGSIISASSMAGLNASPGASPYSSSKFAIIGMVKTDALDYGPHGIRINAICPGFTDTEALNAMATAEQRAAIAAAVPLQRLAAPVEMGRAIVFLSSGYASYINGTALVVDGGATLHRRT